MSDISQGPGWWQASDGKWYPPEQAPGAQPTAPPAGPPPGYAAPAGYGAPAKGNTMLNYCGIDPTLVPYTVDRNPLKVGTFTPGMHIPVLDVKTLLERSPDFVLILAWNFAEEIMEQQQAYRDRGGRFIVPIPSPRIA